MKLNWPLLLTKQVNRRIIGRHIGNDLFVAKLSRIVHTDLFRLSYRSLRNFCLKKKILKNMIFKKEAETNVSASFCLSTEMIYFLTFMRILVITRMIRIEYEY